MTDLAKKNDKDLNKLLREKQEDIRKIRFGVAEKKDPKAHKNVRKEIARIKTELNSRTK
ncbi:MAG: 50S ribosomal protein L29 [Patescibacteria group bacterium UBA2103]